MTLSVEYFAIEGVPGRYFECPSGMGRLSVKSCAENYCIGQQGASARYARLRCHGCGIGALHAAQQSGKPDPSCAGRPMLSGRRICARCLRPSLRIIGGHLCVSCYNRQREALVRQASGIASSHKRAPGSLRVLVVDGQRLSVMRVDRAASALEAAVIAARRSGARCFGWCAQSGIRGAAHVLASI